MIQLGRKSMSMNVKFRRRQVLAGSLGFAAALGFGRLVQPAQASDVVKVGFSPEPYPPFWNQASAGKWSGFEVDLLDALFAKIGKSYQLTPIAWDGIIPALQEKKIDVIFNSMGI